MGEIKKKVYIRVDGSAQIGLGHLVRCMALSQMLKNDFDLHFVCREAPASMLKEIRESGILTTVIDSEKSFLAMLTGKEIVVLDNYFFETAYQRQIKETGCQLVCIDDLHDKEFYADLIINQVPGTRPSDYQAQPYTQYALGPDYALLRAPFLEEARKERKSGQVCSVFICFGGADNRNLTTHTLGLAIKEPGFKKITVVTGTAFQYANELKQLVDSDNRVMHYSAVDEKKMLGLMKASDLAIVPASGILLEVMAAGCRVISGMYVENQRYVFEEYKKAEFFESAEDFSTQYLQNAIKRVFNSPVSNKSLIDGLSGQRVLKTFRQIALEPEVLLRPATESDLEKTFGWASNPQIRAFSFSQKAISFEEHSNWFLKKISSPDCFYFIAEWKGEPIGSIRFDVIGNEATISYLLDPQFHNRGLGIIILKKGMLLLRDMDNNKVVKLAGFVMPGNIPSVKAFERLGYDRETVDGNFKFTKSLN